MEAACRRIEVVENTWRLARLQMVWLLRWATALSRPLLLENTQILSLDLDICFFYCLWLLECKLWLYKCVCWYLLLCLIQQSFMALAIHNSCSLENLGWLSPLHWESVIAQLAWEALQIKDSVGRVLETCWLIMSLEEFRILPHDSSSFWKVIIKEPIIAFCIGMRKQPLLFL